MDLLPVVSTYIETLANQDKFAKIVQYTSKLLAYYLDGTVVKKLNKLSSMISDGRRMNRIGTELKHIRVLSSVKQLGFSNLLIPPLARTHYQVGITNIVRPTIVSILHGCIYLLRSHVLV
eukprot:TRINITY_DN5208_c0_g1_i3.p1 TRINITY_DN5208_c0_g1~~TRINITY_DN5208_c0_g1_i3.p1  ORF type:complete len:120 (+),score=2.67 TRINITY_DN5208_c0_g1_i3:71-430(+)